MPSSQRDGVAAPQRTVAATAEAKGGVKRSDAAIQRRKQKARARNKVKKLRAEGAAVPRALALAVRPAKRAAPRHDKTNGFALKLLAAGEALPEGTIGAAAPAAVSGSSGSTSTAGSVSGRTPSEWCRQGVLARFTNRRVGEVLGDPDDDSEVKLKWLDDGEESRFVHISQLEYVAADVAEYVDDGEGPVRKPHKKAARKAAREAASVASAGLVAVTAPILPPRAAGIQVGAACEQGTVALRSTVATPEIATATAPGMALASAARKGGGDVVEEQRTDANDGKKRKKAKKHRKAKNDNSRN